MRMGAACLLLVSAAALRFAPGADADTSRYEHTIRHIEREVAQQLDESRIPGLSVALVDEKGIVYSRGFGLADRENGVAATPQTRYRVGSITKLVTAVAVLQLVEQGRIELDRPLVDYLPEFSIQSRFAASRSITVRQLLTHHAGLPTDLHKGMWTDMPFTHVTGQLSQQYAVYPPGVVHAYSNLGYSLLGHLIEAVTGKNYDQVVSNRIFDPLGMQGADFSRNDLATGYRDREPGEVLPIRDRPAMGLSASAEDLARLLGLFLGDGEPAVLSRTYRIESMQPQNEQVILDLDDRVGMGWTLDRCRLRNVGSVPEHGGTTLLFSSQVMIVPRYGLGVVVLANTAGARNTLKHLAEEALIAAIAERFEVDAEQPPAAAPATEASPGRPVDGERSSFITRGGLLTLDTGEDELCACTARGQMALVPEPEGWYRLQRSGTRAAGAPRLSHRRIDGHHVVILEDDGRRQRLGTRVEIEEIPPPWLGRTGDYRIVNPDPGFPVTDVCLFEENGLLHLGYRMPRLADQEVALPLAALDDEKAIVLGLGRSRGDTLRIRRIDGREYLQFSGYLARRTHDPLAID